MCLDAMKIWSKFGIGSSSCKILLSQLQQYSKYKSPYNIDYINDHNFIDTPEL